METPTTTEPAAPDPGTAPPAAPAPGRRRWHPDAVLLVGIYLLVRAMSFVADIYAAHVDRYYRGSLQAPFLSWDGGHYMTIAQHGYPAAAQTSTFYGGHLVYSVAGFEPVFPILIAVVHLVVRSYFVAGLVVSVAAGGVGTVLVWKLGTVLADARVGFNAALFFIVFPGLAVAWGMFYAEALGIPLAAGALLLMARERWEWAGLVGVLATATSPLALPLALAPLGPCVRSLRRREYPAGIITMFLTPLGFVGFALWLGARYRDALFWWHLQNQAWSATVDWGRGLVKVLAHPSAADYAGPGWLEWIGVVVVLAAAYALWRARLPSFVNLYCAGLLVLLVVSNQLGFKPRLVAWGFPALVALAVVLKRRGGLVVVIGFAVLMPIVLVAYTTIGNTMLQP